MMNTSKTLSLAYRQGLQDYGIGARVDVNPYPHGTIESLDWSTGWIIAHAKQGHCPVDYNLDAGISDLFTAEDLNELADIADIANSIAPVPIKNDPELERNEYHNWFAKLDPRLQEVVTLLQYDPKKRKGTKEEFYGHLEGLLINRATSFEDFAKMYAHLTDNDPKDRVFISIALSIWNVAEFVANTRVFQAIQANNNQK